jgi:hypothetical protein
MRFLVNLFKAKAANIGERRKWGAGEFEKQMGGKWTRVEAQKHLNMALDRHNLSPKDIDKDTMNEVHEDIEDFHKKVHLGGQDRNEYWKAWGKQHGGAPGKSHRSVVQLAHEMIIQAHGVPTPASRTKLKNKAEAEGKPAPKFEVQPKKDEPGKLVPPRKTIKVQPKIKVPKKMIDPLPDNQTHTNRFVVEGDSGKDYVVSQHKGSGEWQCGCNGWKYHGHKCKHLDRHLDQIKSLVKQGAKPTERGEDRYKDVKARYQEEKAKKATPKITVQPKIPMKAAVAKPKLPPELKGASSDPVQRKKQILTRLKQIDDQLSNQQFLTGDARKKLMDEFTKLSAHLASSSQDHDIAVEKKNSSQPAPSDTRLDLNPDHGKLMILHSRISKRLRLPTAHKRDLASMLNGGEYNEKNDRISFVRKGGGGGSSHITFKDGKIFTYEDNSGVSFGDKAHDKVAQALVTHYT